jgi:hypothetical protein
LEEWYRYGVTSKVGASGSLGRPPRETVLAAVRPARKNRQKHGRFQEYRCFPPAGRSRVVNGTRGLQPSVRGQIWPASGSVGKRNGVEQE